MAELTEKVAKLNASLEEKSQQVATLTTALDAEKAKIGKMEVEMKKVSMGGCSHGRLLCRLDAPCRSLSSPSP